MLLVTCEHATNRVPPAHRALFRAKRRTLASHRGYDPGALVLARALSSAFGAPLLAGSATRLLVDLNRSPGHPRLHSDAVRALDAAERRRIVERYYRPFRNRAHRLVERAVGAGFCVLHLSVHSFTPVLRGRKRSADLGILYDPERPDERRLALQLRRRLGAELPGFRVRLNYPYRGSADGHTTALRRSFAPGTYLGIELELNQTHAGRHGLRAVSSALVTALGSP